MTASRRFKVYSRSAYPQRRPASKRESRRWKANSARAKTAAKAGFLRDLVVRDIASLQNLLVEISEADLKKAVTLLEKAEDIYLTRPTALVARSPICCDTS